VPSRSVEGRGLQRRCPLSLPATPGPTSLTATLGAAYFSYYSYTLARQVDGGNRQRLAAAAGKDKGES
jgi:hypothetical protein